MFKKVHVNILFLDAIANMPKYAKFLKEIFLGMKKLEELALVALSKECSMVIQCKLPPKLKDRGSFTIPITIGTLGIQRVL